MHRLSKYGVVASFATTPRTKRGNATRHVWDYATSPSPLKLRLRLIPTVTATVTFFTAAVFNLSFPCLAWNNFTRPSRSSVSADFCTECFMSRFDSQISYLWFPPNLRNWLFLGERYQNAVAFWRNYECDHIETTMTLEISPRLEHQFVTFYELK